MPQADDTVWKDLIVSLFSVNSYPLQRTWDIADELNREGLFDPTNLGKWNVEEIAKRLLRAGYSRCLLRFSYFDRHE